MNSTPPDHDFDPSILIVSATRAEAKYVPSGARLLVTGIGKMRATAALTRALADPSIVRRLAEAGLEAISGATPEETEATIRREAARWKKVIEERNIRLE